MDGQFEFCFAAEVQDAAALHLAGSLHCLISLVDLVTFWLTHTRALRTRARAPFRVLSVELRNPRLRRTHIARPLNQIAILRCNKIGAFYLLPLARSVRYSRGVPKKRAPKR